jgi:hypothetical protein
MSHGKMLLSFNKVRGRSIRQRNDTDGGHSFSISYQGK